MDETEEQFIDRVFNALEAEQYTIIGNHSPGQIVAGLITMSVMYSKVLVELDRDDEERLKAFHMVSKIPVATQMLNVTEGALRMVREYSEQEGE